MHISLDIETLGTRPGSVVVQVGLVAFDLEGNYTDLGININFDPQEQIDLGATVDWSTMRWWMSQSREAQATLPKEHGDGYKLAVGLAVATDYFKRWGPIEGVWAKGQDFDLPLFAGLFHLIGLKAPWPYNKGRDMRTLNEIGSSFGIGSQQPRPEVAHNALSDAYAQAIGIQLMWGSLPGRSAGGSPVAAAGKE